MLAEALLLFAADPDTIRCGEVSLTGAASHYAELLRAMDTAAIAGLYGKDGQAEMGGKTLTGSAEVAAFLGQFAGFKVRESSMTVSSAVSVPGGWHTDGRFTQTGTTPDGSGYHSQGSFAAEWTCDSAQQWRVRRMQTRGD